MMKLKDILDETLNEEKVYIDFLNKKKGFKQDRIKFNSYEDAVKWARKNFEKFSPDMIKFESINEENEPTNPELWDKAIAAAKRKYDVYPSAYANAFASKWYKEKGGDWKTKKESVNELKLNDLVGNQYKYVIGSGEEKYIGENDKKYVLEMIEKSLKTYLYDDDFALNYLDGSQRKEYNSFFEREVLTPMLKKVDFTLNNFFVLDGDKVKWKFSSNDTRKMVDEIFRKNSKVPSDIKKEYYEYRLEYAGVKLKEGVNESELKGYLIADVVDDIIKVIGPRLVSGEIKQSNRNKIYLKLTDVKVGSGVVKLLKSKFGIDAKEEMFGGKDKFGSIPSVSFFANKVINEELSKKDIEKLTTYKDLSKFIKANKSKINSKDFMYIEDEVEALKYLESDYKKGKTDRQEVEVAVIDAQDYIKRGMGIKVESVNEESYKVAGRPVTLIKGKKSDATDWKVKFQNGKETSLSDVLALIKPFPKGVHWRYKNLESVNEK